MARKGRRTIAQEERCHVDVGGLPSTPAMVDESKVSDSRRAVARATTRLRCLSTQFRAALSAPLTSRKASLSAWSSCAEDLEREPGAKAPNFGESPEFLTCAAQG